MAENILRTGSEAQGVSRRDFVRTVGAAVAAASVPLIGGRSALATFADQAGPTPKAPAETAVARFFKTLTDEQRKTIAFPFDHPLRSQVKNNWAIVPQTISEMSLEQQDLCTEIFKNLCSEEGYERFTRQMDEDYGGFENYHVAVFGEPGTDQPFEWVLTGRHDTLRADGNSVNGVAFGGPIFYGHASHSFNEDANHTDNVWWYQGQQANKIFKTLDDKQQAQALVKEADEDTSSSIEFKGDKLERGLVVADLDSQQKEMVKKLLDDMVMPYRALDVAEVRECLDEEGGIDKLRLTYFKEGDIGEDGVWDMWRLDGPAFAWFFRGSPHVHTWLHVGHKA